MKTLEQRWAAIRDKPRPLSINDSKEWYAIKREQGKLIDPATCGVFFEYTDMTDPYYIHGDDDRSDCVGRSFFAKNPGSDYAVAFSEIPRAILIQLEAKKLAAHAEGWRRVIEMFQPHDEDWPPS